MTTIDAFLAPVVTEVLLTALTRLRSDGAPATLWVGSPWLTDVPLFPGTFTGSFPFLLPGIEAPEVASLSSFIGTWVRNGGSASILVRSYDDAYAHETPHEPARIGSALIYVLSDELAKVAHDPDLARTLAKRAGFPPEHLPEFKTASIFWSTIAEQASRGMADVNALISEVAKQFPYSERLSECRIRFEGSHVSTDAQPTRDFAASATSEPDPFTTVNWTKKVARGDELELLVKCLESGVEVIFARGLQDRFVVVPDVVISGSATMTYSDLYLNRERLTLFNRSSAFHDYETARAVCENHIETARLAGQCTPPYNSTGVADADSLFEIRRGCSTGGA